MGDSKEQSDKERQEALRKDIDFTEHMMEEDDILKKYNVTKTNGLTSEQVEAQRAIHGWNRLTPPPEVHWIIKYLMEYTNFFSLLLLGGGLLCFIGYALGSQSGSADPTNLYLGVVLWVVTVITCTFSYLQNAKSAAIMEGFKKMIPQECLVLRNGAEKKMDASELVPGDVVKLKEGDKIPADVRLLEANEVKVDNASLTGESEPQDRISVVPKDEKGNIKKVIPIEAENLAFYTTNIVTGSCKAIVIGTADHTLMGQIAGLATETKGKETPIAIEIEFFIHLISGVAMFLGFSFFVITAVNQATSGLGLDFISNIVNVIGIIVANVPEGLLATVTVSLALTAQRMHKKNVLVKNLESVETLGSTSIIASDKTGTLTQNRMTVQHCWFDEQIFATPPGKNVPSLTALLAAGSYHGEPVYDRDAATFKKLQMVTALCNNAQFMTAVPYLGNEHLAGFGTLKGQEILIDMKKGSDNSSFNLLQLKCSGDASESGLLKFVQPLDDASDFRASYPKVFEIKFNSTNKWQLSIHEQPDSDKHVLVLKGAPERVIKRCTKYMKGGEQHDIDLAWGGFEWNEAAGDDAGVFGKAYQQLGGLGERVLGFAFAELDAKKFPKGFQFTQKPDINFKEELENLTFAGLLSLIDPPREGVPEAVEKCKRARIRVFMVTGDHPITAEAIAKKVGIIDQEVMDAGNAMVIKGDDIRKWEEVQDPVAKQQLWDDALDHNQIVFARVSPAHKLLIVENNQRRGEIVAVTGDGVNDAPALSQGDIGIAMGIAGMDVSKEAADMILIDDNFASIVNGVEEGRLIFDNLKKSIAYTLSSNIPEIGPFLLNITINLPLALSTTMILMVDLGTDMVPAISLAYELKEADIMDRPPRNAATDRLVNRRLITFAYLQIGIIQALAGFFTYMTVLNDYGFAPWTIVYTGALQTFGDTGASKGFSMMCSVDSDGRPDDCGFGCKSPNDKDDWERMTGSKDDSWAKFCDGGCKIPFFDTYAGADHEVGIIGTPHSNETIIPDNCDPTFRTGANNVPLCSVSKDPFIEFTTGGFRGLECEDVCDRNCYWYNTNVKGKSQEVHDDYCVTAEDVQLFEQYCSHEPAENDADNWGFINRGKVDKENIYTNRGGRNNDHDNALKSAFYWWDGKPQYYPNAGYQRQALMYAQTAYFISIIVVQWADLLICKTRKLSIFTQGMENGFMNFGIVFETVLGMTLVYCPLFWIIFSTRPLHILHWFPGIPWSMFIFVYDEIRKSIMRQYPKGWLDSFTYW